MRKLMLCKGQALCECCLLQGAEPVDDRQPEAERRCPYGRNGDVFRKQPLKREKVAKG